MTTREPFPREPESIRAWSKCRAGSVACPWSPRQTEAKDTGIGLAIKGVACPTIPRSERSETAVWLGPVHKGPGTASQVASRTRCGATPGRPQPVGAGVGSRTPRVGAPDRTAVVRKTPAGVGHGHVAATGKKHPHQQGGPCPTRPHPPISVADLVAADQVQSSSALDQPGRYFLLGLENQPRVSRLFHVTIAVAY